MKNQIYDFISKEGREIPSTLKRYLKWIIFGVVSLFMTGIALVILVLYLIIKLLTGLADRELPQAPKQTIEERVNLDEQKIQDLERRLQMMEER